jgi:hypothetical protein
MSKVTDLAHKAVENLGGPVWFAAGGGAVGFLGIVAVLFTVLSGHGTGGTTRRDYFVIRDRAVFGELVRGYDSLRAAAGRFSALPDSMFRSHGTGLPIIVPTRESDYSIVEHCDTKAPGLVRGLVLGRFNEDDQPADTAISDLVVLLQPDAPTDQKPWAVTGGFGQFRAPITDTQTNYEIIVVHPAIAAPRGRVTLAYKSYDSLTSRCLLPSIDGRIPLSRVQLARMQQLR